MTNSNIIPNIEEHLYTPVPTSHQTREAMDEIAQMTRDYVAQIPEPVFREKILPLLMPVEAGAKAPDRRVWLDLAGDYFRPIDVIAENGEVLFTVHPLLDTVPTELGRTGEYSMGEIIGRAQLREKISPPVAAMELRSGLDTFLPEGVAEARMHQRYGKIFDHYGINPYNSKTSSTQSAPEAASTGGGVSSPLEDDDFTIT